MPNILVPPRFEDAIADAEMYFASQSARATDFNPGSVVRTILEVVAQIQERRDIAVWASLDRAIDEAVFDAWGFPRQEAQPATGQVTLYPGVGVTTPFAIRQGSLFRVPDSPNLVYEVISPAKNPDGTLGWISITGTNWTSNPNISSSTLNVRAIQSGAAGNVGAKLITQAIQTIPGIAEIKNLQALTNGRDASTEADRRAAFTAYIQSLPRGTVESLRYGAKTTKLTDPFGLITEQVRKVAIFEGTSPATILYLNAENTVPLSVSSGNVAVFVHNGAGVASSELLAKCQDILNGYIDSQGIRQPGWRAAGIATTVHPAKLKVQDVVVNITVAKGYQVSQVAQLVILATQNAFNILDVGETLLWTDLLMFLKLVPGVLDVSLITPSTDVFPDVNALVSLRNISGTATLSGTTVQTTIQYPTSM